MNAKVEVMSRAKPEPEVCVTLVEDDAALGAALRFALTIAGFRVCLYTAAEPLLARANLDCACLVADLHLPGASGLTLVETLRARGAEQPMILMTTEPSPATRARVALMGGTIVEKPILGDGLVKAIRALIRS